MSITEPSLITACPVCGAEMEVMLSVPLGRHLTARLATTTQALALAVEIIDDCWNQWAYDVGGRKVSGGLSTLEWIEADLPKLRAALAEPVGAPPEPKT